MKKTLFFLFLQVLVYDCFAQVSVRNLLTENQTNPIGLGVSKPRFSWQLFSGKQNIRQTACEIQVKDGKNIVWNPGKISSDASLWIEYQGSPLQSGKKYSWQVRVWDNQGNVSAWATAFFQTSLLTQQDWKASWISSGLKADTTNGIVPAFRKTFSANKKITVATAYITSLGLYDARINGKRIGDAYLTPGWTSYQKHLQFQTYDVTSLVKQGKNSLGVLLGSGWYRTGLTWLSKKNIYGSETALLFQMEITYADGSKEMVVSDASWKAHPSEIRYAEIYNGETIDARVTLTNWENPDFDDKAWTTVVVKNLSKDNLTASVNEPIRKHEKFKPIKVLTTPKGETVLDFGQNLVGWVEFQTSGKTGDTVRLSHVEMLDKKGDLYFENLRSAKAQAMYVLKGGATETFEPHFTFFGFRYVRVDGIAGKINPDNFTAVALYSDMKPSGTFECSNPLINQLQKNIQWGQRGNFLDVPTDCPQRDERLGWTGDAEVFSRTAAFNFNVDNFFTKWLKDVAADQAANGSVPFVIPDVLSDSWGSSVGAAGWSDASIIIPWNLYTVYGDKRVLENQYESMKRYLGYMQNASKNDLWNTGFQFADWLSYKVDDSKEMMESRSSFTDVHLVAQAYYAYSCDLMIKTAGVLGKTEDKKQFEALQEKVKNAFLREYVTPGGRLISETQTAYILALQFDLLPENLRRQATERLVNNVRKYKNHLTTGFLGTPHLCHVLSRFGQTNVAYDLLLQETYPSWLYPVKMGATTIWERWDSMKPDSTFQDPGMTSFNHYAYGAIGDWMYRTITGIDTREEGAGYKEISIKPEPGGKLTFAKATLQTGYGLLSSGWRTEGGTLYLSIEIPANTAATIYLPVQNTQGITVNGQMLGSLKELQATQTDKNVVLKTGSGKYDFMIPDYTKP